MITDVSEKQNDLILRVYIGANCGKTLWNVRTHRQNVAENMITDVSETQNDLILRVYTGANCGKSLWNVRTHRRNVAENDVSPKGQHLSAQTSHTWWRRCQYSVLRQLRIYLPFSLFPSFTNNIKYLNSGIDLCIKTKTTITLHFITCV